jgi:D-alanyl-D-alanine carboxypeptidase/D-alanyl-D-alanine-endopeptidase (penicillin-binding protein 4)
MPFVVVRRSAPALPACLPLLVRLAACTRRATRLALAAGAALVALGAPAPRPVAAASVTVVAVPTLTDGAAVAVPSQETPRRRARTTTRRPAAGARSAASARRGPKRAAAARAVPAARAAPAVRATAPRSAAALAADFGAMLSRPDGGQWGAMVVSLTRGDTLFARHADSLLLPASTLKMYTAALALDRLGPDWRFRTEALRDGPLEADGTLRGNLILRGDGDPAFSRRFHRGGYDAPVQALAERIAAAGVRRVTGSVVGDASAFEARTIPEGWLTRYAGAGYAAPFGALSINENIVVVAIHPDGRVLLEPATTGIPVENAVRVTGGAGVAVRVHRAADGHVVARGSIGRGAPVRRLQLVVDDPARFTAGALHAALAARGIPVEGGLTLGRAPAQAQPVAALESPPLATLVAVMNRESINHYAELLFRNAVRGAERRGEGSAAAGNALLQRWLTSEAGAAPASVLAHDGSGLSVLDRVTPRSMVQLLAHAHAAPWGPAFHASLPVAGESELLRHRMRGTPAQGNLHAKTGTTNEVVGLGGYVTAENGEILAFSFLFNGRSRWNARATIDAMGETLAGFSR